MKYFFLSALLLFCAALSYSQNNNTDCSRFRTGEFSYRDTGTNTIWTIKRTAKHQTEKNEKQGVVVKKKIKWLSPCEYQLTQTWTNSKELKKGNFKSLTYSIVSITGETYKYSCSCSDGTSIAGTVVKMPG